MASLRSRNGQSVIEVLVAIFILATIATAGFVLLSSAFSEGIAVRERLGAENVLADGFEAVRQIRDRSFGDLNAGAHGLLSTEGIWTFYGTDDQDGIYRRTVTIDEIDDHARDVTVTVSWTNHLGRHEQRASTVRLTAWRTPVAPPASNCYGYAVTGDWTSPVVLGSADIGSGNQGTDVVVDLPYAYVSGIASSSSKPDLFVFDVSDPSLPVLIDSVDVGSGGLNALTLSGSYLYAASSNDSQEFQAFDVSDPYNVTRVAYTNPSGSADGLTVLAKEDLVALGRKSSSSSEIYFYDVSDPTTPSLLTTHNVSGDVNDFAASEAHLYAVSSAVSEDLITFDVTTDPLHPTVVDTYDLRDGTQDISLAYQEPGILFAGNVADQFIAIDVSDPLNPSPNDPVLTGGEVKDMVCTNNDLLFLGTDNSNKEFLILDISDLSGITEYASLNFPQVLSGIDFAANMVFAAVRSNDALRIITSSP